MLQFFSFVVFRVFWDMFLYTVTTDVFHAQYRVLEAFSIFNLILGACAGKTHVQVGSFTDHRSHAVCVFLLFLGFLALREHRRGYRKVWLYPVPLYPWFNKKASAPFTAMPRTRSGRRGKSGGADLPKPVTAKGGFFGVGESSNKELKGVGMGVGMERKGSTRRPQPSSDLEKGQGAPGAGAKSENRKSAFWVWVERPKRMYQQHQQHVQQHRSQQQQRQQRQRQTPAPAAPAAPAASGSNQQQRTAAPISAGARGTTTNGAASSSWTRTRAPPVPARPPIRQNSSSRQPLLQRQTTTREYTRTGESGQQTQSQSQPRQQTQPQTQAQPRAVPPAHTRDYRPERATRDVERSDSQRRQQQQQQQQQRPELAPRRTGSGPAARR